MLPEHRQWRRSGVFIVNLKHTSHLFSSVHIFGFGQVNVCWDGSQSIRSKYFDIFFRKNNNISYPLIRTRMYVFVSRERNDIFFGKIFIRTFSCNNHVKCMLKGNLFLVSSSLRAMVVFKKKADGSLQKVVRKFSYDC